MTPPRFTLATAALAVSLLLCGTARGVTDEEFNASKHRPPRTTRHVSCFRHIQR